MKALILSFFIALAPLVTTTFPLNAKAQLSRSKKFKHNQEKTKATTQKTTAQKATTQKKSLASGKKITSGKCTTELVVDGVISSATLDSVKRALEITQKKGCSSLMLLINTPGGLLLSTRKIVELILDSPVPILCLVHPSGAHAGSAGAIILQACHVNGAVTATNIGAATPILGAGGKASEDLRNKMINDATSWLDSLTALRKRNKQFGRDIITKAKSVSGKEGHQIGAIDFHGNSKEDFLKFSQGVRVKLSKNKTHFVKVGPLESIPLGVRHHVVSFVTDPEIAYLMFTGSLLLLYFELTHPGMVVPGVVGAMGLVLSLTGMHKLNFEWGGMILILLGIVFMILEALTAVGFGFLGLGGAVSFVVGSFFLFDPAEGVNLPYSTIFFVSLLFISVSLGISYLVFTSLRRKKNGEHLWVGSRGKVVKTGDTEGDWIEIKGELWKFRSKNQLEKGDIVKVIGYSGMVFDVERVGEKK